MVRKSSMHFGSSKWLSVVQVESATCTWQWGGHEDGRDLGKVRMNGPWSASGAQRFFIVAPQCPEDCEPRLHWKDESPSEIAGRTLCGRPWQNRLLLWPARPEPTFLEISSDFWWTFGSSPWLMVCNRAGSQDLWVGRIQDRIFSSFGAWFQL